MKGISIIGLGKLGLPLAVVFANKNYFTIGIDIDDEKINLLNSDGFPDYEPGLKDLFIENRDNMCFTNEFNRAIEETDISIILVNTPSNKDGSFSNEYVEASLIKLSLELEKSNKPYHLFVISSTVMPGSINNSFIPLINKISDREVNKGYGICFIPDFVALGTVINDFQNPDMLIVGESEKKAGDIAISYFSTINNNKATISRMSIIEAEIAKVSLNTFICMKIGFANFLTNICEQYNNANVDNITNSIGLDRRIGKDYLKGGLPYGGTCFPRDTWAFIKMAEKVGFDAVHIKTIDKMNSEHYKKIKELIMKYDPKSVSILGIAFKEHTSVLTESTGYKLIGDLLEFNVIVNIYDPVKEAINSTKIIYDNKIKYYRNYADCVKSSKFCIITNMNKEYENIEKYLTKDHIVLDCWRAFNTLDVKEHIKIGVK